MKSYSDEILQKNDIGQISQDLTTVVELVIKLDKKINKLVVIYGFLAFVNVLIIGVGVIVVNFQ